MSLWGGEASLSHELRFLQPGGQARAEVGEKTKCMRGEGGSERKREECFTCPGKGLAGWEQSQQGGCCR